MHGDLPDQDVLKVYEAYKKFTGPIITTMAISSDVLLVDSAYEPVQKGSPISYRHPVPLSWLVIPNPNTSGSKCAQAGANNISLCLQPPTATPVCHMPLNWIGNENQRVEWQRRVAQCQAAKANIFQVQGGVPCERPQFCWEPSRKNYERRGSHG